MSKKKILVVDDEANILESLSDLLRVNDYDVVTARDGKEGIEVAKKENPDLILLDIMMPKVSGLELLKKIKSSKKSASTPVIILSAKSDVETLNEAMWNYAEKYICKPYNPEELLASVEASLSTSYS